MESEVLKLAISQGIFAVLFVSLFFYVLRENSKREERYQGLISKLSDKFDEIRNDVKELATKFDDWIGK